MANERINWEELQSQTFYWLRFPFIVMVVFAHSPGFGVIPDAVNVCDPLSLSSVDYWNLLRMAFTSVLSRMAVPGFFLMSGYLFFYKIQDWNKSVYAKKLKNRFYSILIPYVSWNTICLVTPIVMLSILGLKNPIYSEALDSYWEKVGWIHWIWDGETLTTGTYNWLGIWHHSAFPINFPLWFMRDLMVLCILTPVIYWLIKKVKLYYIIILSLLFLLDIWPNIHGFSSMGMLFFSVGAYLSINKLNMLMIFRKVEIPCYLLTIVLVCVLIPTNFNCTLGIIKLAYCFRILGAVSAFNIASRLLQKKIVTTNKWLSERYFFIYVFHAIYFVIFCTELVFPFSTDRSITYRFVEYMSTPFVKIIICLIVYEVMRKTMPRVLGILLGKR